MWILTVCIFCVMLEISKVVSFSEKYSFVCEFPAKYSETKKNRGEIPCKPAKRLNSNHFSKAQW